MIHYSTFIKTGILSLLLSCTVQVMGQISVSGKVTDQQTGEVIPGASVIVKGTNSGTGTNAEGMYELTVPDSKSVLIFSFVGFSSQEIALICRPKQVSTMVQASRRVHIRFKAGRATIQLTQEKMYLSLDILKCALTSQKGSIVAGQPEVRTHGIKRG